MAAAELNISQDFVSILLSDNPGCDVLESFVSKLDDQLAENELQLESCLKDVAFCMSSSTSGNVSDVLPKVCKDTFLASSMCNNSDTSQTMQLITGWVKILDSGDENELLVLQSMIHLSSMEGLVFPKCTVANASSLNCGTDMTSSASGTVDPSAVWNSLCLRIRNKVLNQLEQLPIIECPDKQTPQFGCHSNKRRQLISSLHLLFTSSQIAMQYRELRQNQLQKLIDQQLHTLPSSGGLKRQASCDQSVERFVSLMSKVTGMMAEDFELLISGGFEDIDLDSSFDCMSDIYFERLLIEIETIVDKFVRELQSNAENSRKRGSKAEKSEETPGEAAGMNKSPSDIGFLGRHFSLTSRRNRSRSADNLIANGQLSNRPQQLTNVKSFEGSSFDALLHLVECLVKAEDQLEAWQAVVLTSWHHVVDVGREATPSCRLKSAMKVPQCNVSANSKPEVKKTRRLLFGMKRDSLKSNAIHPLCVDSANDTGERGSNETVPLIRDASLAEHGHFDWQRCFTKLTEDVAKQLAYTIRSTLQRTLHDDSEQFEKSGTVTSRLVVDDLVTVGYDLSKPVASSTWAVFNELRRMVWFAKAGKEPSLVAWRTAYVEELLNCLENIADWLEKVCDAPSNKHPVTGLYVALNTASFWLEKIHYFELEPSLDESSKEELKKLSSRFQEISDNMISCLTKWHSRQLATTVLCDSESHNWTDTKEFCEGERCSYDIQVWNLYMNGLQSDLWSSCQLNDARQILSEVLKGSLFHFMWRYTRVRPSRRRIPQFVGDVTAILLCTSNLLYTVCKSLSTFIDPCEADGDLFSIHNYCSVLLATMAVVGAPLEVLYRVFRKGFNRKSSSEEVAKGSNISQWLCWINPRLFPRANTCYEDLPVNSAIFIQLYLLKYQRDRCRYDLLLQSLLMKDYKLTILLLTHLEEIVSKSANMSSAAAAESVFFALIDILCKCADFPAAIAYTVLPILERSNGWNIFDGNCIIGKTCQCPLWLVAIQNQLKPFLLGAVDEVCRDLLHGKCSQSPITASPGNLVPVDKLPCGCTVSSQSFVETDLSDDISRSIRCVISRLAGNMHALPQSVLVLLHHLHKSYVGRGASSLKPHQSVGLTVLATCLRLTLLDCDLIASAFNSQLTSDNKRQLETLAENVYYVLTAVDSDEFTGKVPENVIKIMTSNRNWLLEQVDTINEHINSEMYSPSKQQSVEGNLLTDFTQTSLRLLAQSLCVTQAGLKLLDTVYQFVVVDNFDWIINQLGISEEVTGSAACPKIAATPSERVQDDTCQPSSNFNPLKEYCCIGPGKFDHVAILKFSHNWQSLLQCELGLSKVGFRSLLFHRHDVVEGAQIEDAERRLVEALLKKFDKDIDGTAV